MKKRFVITILLGIFLFSVFVCACGAGPVNSEDTFFEDYYSECVTFCEKDLELVDLCQYQVYDLDLCVEQVWRHGCSQLYCSWRIDEINERIEMHDCTKGVERDDITGLPMSSRMCMP